MRKKQILIVGGYGVVGTVVSSLLSKKSGLSPIIAGRNKEKAEALAEKLGCGFRTIDIKNEDSIKAALEDVNIRQIL